MSAIDTLMAMPLLFLGPGPRRLLVGRRLFLRSGMPGAWLRGWRASGDEAFEGAAVREAALGLLLIGRGLGGADITTDLVFNNAQTRSRRAWL